MNRIFLISILLIISFNAHSKNIRVGKSGNIHSIQAAIKLAADGDTIFVEPGHYHEGNLLIQKQVSLIGIDHPVLDGDHKYEIISVKADKVLIQGFKVVHSGVSSIEDFAGIKIYNRRNVIVRD